MNEIHPYIQMNARAINQQDNINDPDYNPNTTLLFDVFIAEQELKIGFIVRWNDPDAVPPPQYEFEIIRIKSLHLAGVDREGSGVTHVKNDVSYPQAYGSTPTMGNADPTIVNVLFNGILDKYKIEISSIIMHSFSSFESNDFTIDPDVLEDIKSKVNSVCCKIKHDIAYKG